MGSSLGFGKGARRVGATWYFGEFIASLGVSPLHGITSAGEANVPPEIVSSKDLRSGTLWDTSCFWLTGSHVLQIPFPLGWVGKIHGRIAQRDSSCGSAASGAG